MSNFLALVTTDMAYIELPAISTDGIDIQTVHQWMSLRFLVINNGPLPGTLAANIIEYVYVVARYHLYLSRSV